MMTMWTIYDHPKDYPEVYVAREWVIDDDAYPRSTASVMIAGDIEILREILLTQMGRTCIARSDQDDPKIVETWV
jgi:hypothetical protein